VEVQPAAVTIVSNISAMYRRTKTSVRLWALQADWCQRRRSAPQAAEVDPAAAEDSDRFAGGVGEQAPEQVFAGDLGPVAAAAGPPGHLDGLPAAFVEGDLGGRAGEGDAQQADA
jgi:hypothetical protein